MTNEFVAAINKARLRLAQIEGEQARLAQEKAQLTRSIEALAPLLSEQPSKESHTLADSMRTVMASYAMIHFGTIFTPKLVRDLLTEMGFDFSPYNNHMASIHTAMRRMEKAGELQAAEDVDFGGGYKWKGINRNALRDRVMGTRAMSPTPDEVRASTKTLGQKIGDGLFGDGKKK